MTIILMKQEMEKVPAMFHNIASCMIESEKNLNKLHKRVSFLNVEIQKYPITLDEYRN